MKKFLIVLGVIFGVALFAVAEDNFYSTLFMIRFLKCIPTKMMSFSTTQDGVALTHQRYIFSWHHHLCGYKVVEKIGDETKTYECNLNRSQVTDFAHAMKSDPTGTGAAKDYWKKLKEDENSCTEGD